MSLYQLHVLIRSLALMPAHAQRVLSGHMHTRRIEAHIRSPDCPRARSSGSKRQRWPQHKTVQCSTHIAQSLKAWYRLVLVRTCHAATMSSRRERLRQPGTIQRSSLHPRSSEYGLRAATSIRRVGSMLADRSTRAVMLIGDGCHAAPSSIGVMRHVCTDWLVDRSRGSVASCCYSLSRATPVRSVSS